MIFTVLVQRQVVRQLKLPEYGYPLFCCDNGTRTRKSLFEWTHPFAVPVDAQLSECAIDIEE
jgi:hypothetical protein